MNSELATVPTPEDRELARLLVEIETYRRVVNALETERRDLEAALTQFATEVKARVGPLKDEIRDIRFRIEEIRQRINRLKADPSAIPEDVERELADELAGHDDMPPRGSGFNGRHSPPPGFGANGHKRKQSSQREAEILRLYRELAKRHHPDLARTTAERERREEIMLRINVAYRDRDLIALQAMMLEVELSVPTASDRLTEQRLAWAQHEHTRLQREISSLQVRIDTLRSSETFTLWQAQSRNTTVLDDLEMRTRQRLKRERERLEDATAQYARISIRRQVIQRRAAAAQPASMSQT